MDKSFDPVERLLAESNKDNVTLIGDGLTKQHFIELDALPVAKGKIYEQQVKGTWTETLENNENKSSSAKSQKELPSIFPTEVSEKVFLDARSRLVSRLSGLTSNNSASNLDKTIKTGLFEKKDRSYLTDKPEQIKEDLLQRGFDFYQIALAKYEEGQFEKALLQLEKAFTFNSFDVQFFLLKCDCFIQLCDFKSAILTLNRLISLLSIYFEPNNPTFIELKAKLFEKIAFCHYMIGQTNYDSKLYLEALDSFNKACDIKPNNLTFKIKSISCLHAMNRLSDALSLMNKIINENDSYKDNSNLYVLRARLYLKDNNISKCFHDLKSALKLDATNKEASVLMDQLQDTAEQLRNSGLVLSLNNRVTDALNKLTGAIAFNPGKPEYHLQRGILYKRLRDFNSAIDDFLLGLEKINEYEVKDSNLFSNFQRQILLTYNDFAIQCYEKRFYDDAIVLLNKAIKIEKNEKGFYVNRGDCFYKKNDKRFALLDYEQANEIDPKDEEIKDRISKIYYELAVEKYDEKNYQEATKNFNKAIEHSPNKCKYYISRARTLYFSDDKYGAQKDICVSILLEPSNPEIPNIISRIFTNQNLTEVLNSKQMQEAKDYLRSINVNNVFEINKNVSEKVEQEKEKPSLTSRLQPSMDEVLKEEHENLELIEEQRKINKMIKESVKLDLKSNVPKLKPLAVKFDQTKRNNSREVNWRKFNIGIGSSG